MVALPPERYRDLWSSRMAQVDAQGLCRVDSGDGIALLVLSQAPQSREP